MSTGSPRYQPYSAYRSSGVTWLGEIPAHWGVKRLKYAAQINTVTLPENTDPEYHLRYVDIGNVDTNGRILDVEEMTFAAAPSRARRRVHTGDTIISTVRTYLKAIAFVEDNAEDLIVSTGFATLTPETVALPKFLWRVVQSDCFVDAVVAHSEGVGYPAITPSNLASLPVWLPPLAEQLAIAAFLDRETARLDALIAKKERLLALLSEKRAALISHAVTKGLDPSAPMRDSGIAWLGEIPAHWEIKAFGHALFYISYGFTNPMPVADNGPYMLTANDIGDGTVRYETARKTTEDAFVQLLTDKSRPRKGDVLLTKDGTLGRVAVFDGAQACINQSVALLRINERVAYSDFVQNMLRGAVYQDRMVFDAGGTTIKHIYISRLAKMPVAFPPLDEQRAICASANRHRQRIDDVIAKIGQAIERLREYRAALISAAVTGKIDVRGEAAVHE